MGRKQAVSSIIGVIIEVIVAAMFVILAATIIGDWLASFPRVSGAIGDTTSVICFGGGVDHHMHCLEKTTGKELFSVGTPTKFSPIEAIVLSTPVLTKDSVYFGLGKAFCAYDASGTNKWGTCVTHGSISGDAAVGWKEPSVACYGSGDKVFCYDKTKGEPQFSATVTNNVIKPIITDDGFIFSGTKGHTGDSVVRICKFSTRSSGEVVLPVGIGPPLNTDKCMTLGQGDGSDMSFSNDTLCLSYGLFDFGCFDLTGNTVASTSSASKVESTIDSDWVYYAEIPVITNQHITNEQAKWTHNTTIYRTNLTKIKSEKKWSREAVITVDGMASTGLAVSGNTLCFGSEDPLLGKKTGTVRCIDIAKKRITLRFTAPVEGTWDDLLAQSKPAIIEDKVYFAIGDHVMSYYLNGTTYWPEQGFDFDHQIMTDIAYYQPSPEELNASSVLEAGI